MRLCFAIDLDEPARNAAERVGRSIARRAAEPGASISWVTPARLHLTPAFLGDVSHPPSGALRTLGAAPFPQPPFELSLAVAGVFPSAGPPRVTWRGPGMTHPPAEIGHTRSVSVIERHARGRAGAVPGGAPGLHGSVCDGRACGWR